ncbi:reverse transcriptase domain-containing protein, partial [Tanacetum coccineum]
GKEKRFSVREVWKAIRIDCPKVIWYRHVWFSQCIPRHAFILWVAIKGRLKTLDRISRWVNTQSMVLWERLKPLAKLEGISNDWACIISFISNKPATNTIWSIIQRDVECLYKIIVDIIRMKLMGLTMKCSPDVLAAASIWNFKINNFFGLIVSVLALVSGNVIGYMIVMMEGFVMDGFLFSACDNFKWLLLDWFAGYVKLWLLLDGFEVLVVLLVSSLTLPEFLCPWGRNRRMEKSPSDFHMPRLDLREENEKWSMLGMCKYSILTPGGGKKRRITVKFIFEAEKGLEKVTDFSSKMGEKSSLEEVIEIESFKFSAQHSVNDFVVINIPEEDVEPKQIILNPDDQPMWENAKIVAPTPNYAIVQPNVGDNFVISSTHLNMIRESKFDGYLRVDPHDQVCEFLVICDMFKYGETQSEAVKLMIFPFTLCDKAKFWFNELNEESIT